jgi:Carboxypeptidase regulatory-like domain
MPKKGTGEIVCFAAIYFTCPLFLEGRTHIVSGCVKDHAGAPVPGAIVHLIEIDGYPKLMVAANAKGCYRQPDVPDGFYEIRAESNGATVASRNVAIEGGFMVTVDLQYTPKPPPAGPTAAPMINLKMLEDTFKATPKEDSSAMLKSLTFTLKVIDSGDPIMGTVEIARPAPAAGMKVDLAVSHPSLVLIPEEITIPEGQTTVSFPLTTRQVRGPSDVVLRVKASDQEGSRTSVLTIRSHTRLVLQIEGSGKWRVSSMPPGINCDTRYCTSAFAEGSRVQLWTETTPGTTFEGWSGDCGVDGEVVVSGPMKCTARFSSK